MGKKQIISSPIVLQTELSPLTELFRIDVEDSQPTEQWYYDNTGEYSPDRQIIPLVLVPKLSVIDPETNTSYSTSDGTLSFYQLTWTVKTYANGTSTTVTVTQTADGASVDYYRNGNKLVVKKNVPYTDATNGGVEITCSASYSDPRPNAIGNTSLNVSETVKLTTSRDSTVIKPHLEIISPNYSFNPLTAADPDSEFTFEGKVTVPEDAQQLSDSFTAYRAVPSGQERVLPMNGTNPQCCSPTMDIRYGEGTGSTVLFDQTFYARATANGAVSTIPNESAHIIAMRGNACGWNQLLKNGTTTTSQGITWTAVSPQILRMTGKPTNQYVDVSAIPFFRTVLGHRYYTNIVLISGTLPSGITSKLYDQVIRNGSPSTGGVIGTATETYENDRFQFNMGSSYSSMASIDASLAFTCIDLDVLGLDSTTYDTVAKVEAWLSTYVGKQNYYTYNAGTILGSKFTGIRSEKKTGTNTWQSDTTFDVTKIYGKLNGAGDMVQVFPRGLLSAGAVYDELKKGDNGFVANVRVGAIAIKDFANYEISYSSGWLETPAFNLIGIVAESSNPVVQARAIKRQTANLRCDRYKYIPRKNGDTQEKITINEQMPLIVDPRYTSIEDFRAAMGDAVVYYELETPRTYTDLIYDPNGMNVPLGVLYGYEWYGLSDNAEVKIDTLPCYVSGQGTNKVTVDAMYGENINVILRLKKHPWDTALLGERDTKSVTWKIPPLSVHTVSENGGAVRGTTGSFRFSNIVNMHNNILSDAIKTAHMRFEWKLRKDNVSNPTTVGWGNTIDIPASSLLNTSGQRTALVKCVAYVLSPYKEVTEGGETDYERSIDW